MRKALNIVATLAKELAHRRGLAFKAVVHRALEAALRALASPGRAEWYRATTFSMGAPRVPDLDAALRLSAELEADEIARKLVLRK